MASAAISRIKSYKLNVLSTIVETDIDNDEMEQCLKEIDSGVNASENKCSLLLIAEKGNDMLRMLALSYDDKLNTEEWLKNVAKMVNGEITESNMDTTTKMMSMKIKMVKSEYTATKEKENALAASFAYLRKIGMIKDDEEEEVGNLLEDYGF